MEQTPTYELIDITWSLDYDLRDDTPSTMVRDDNAAGTNEAEKPQSIEYDPEGIPMGQSMEEIRMRQRIIHDFMVRWREDNPEKKRFNKSLNEDILVRQISMIEAFEHSAKSCRSTKAVLMLDTVLSDAVKVATTRPKAGDKNQKGFKQVLAMLYEDINLGRIKLTVGVRIQNEEKVQYGITALREDQEIVDPSLVMTMRRSRPTKKAPHKK